MNEITPANEFDEGTPLARTRKQYNDISTLCKKRDALIESYPETKEHFEAICYRIYEVHMQIKALRGDK
jgi:hypothetical protein